MPEPWFGLPERFLFPCQDHLMGTEYLAIDQDINGEFDFASGQLHLNEVTAGFVCRNLGLCHHRASSDCCFAGRMSLFED